ncbi:MAG TPA: hypothetical protein VE326_11245 [Candidatus Binatia bacterium]|nr:hypothetical protein [Candidatus Binatia bacterium]
MNIPINTDSPEPVDAPKVRLSLAGGFGVWLPPLISLAAAAYLLTVSPKTVKRLIKKDKLAAHKVGADGRKFAVVTESVGAYLNDTVVTPADLDGDDEGDDVYGTDR